MTWTPPVLLLRTDSRPNDSDGAADLRGSGSPEHGPGPEAGATATAAHDGPSSNPRPDHGVRARGAAGESLWSLMQVRMPLPEVVSVPAGCMMHARWVSLVTLLAAVLCSGAVVVSALC